MAPSFAYAHTLCGHEHVAVDDMDAAAACFRTALLHDPRHYQAWYGLGMIFYRTQRLQLADFHFGEALRLAPDNSALHTYRGMVASKQRDWERALECLERALQCNPRNVLARSQQAQVLIGQGRLDEGLAMVEQMLEASPREAFLHFLKATACAKRGDKEAALAHYTVAMDLDSKVGKCVRVFVLFCSFSPQERTADQDSHRAHLQQSAARRRRRRRRRRRGGSGRCGRRRGADGCQRGRRRV